jgi:hypothetical protein
LQQAANAANTDGTPEDNVSTIVHGVENSSGGRTVGAFDALAKWLHEYCDWCTHKHPSSELFGTGSEKPPNQQQ